MNIHLLCEGNPETSDSWSGISQSILSELRALGHTVTWTDVDLYGWERWLGAALTLSFDRQRWWSRYHLTAAPFALRSRKARAGVARAPAPDVVLQFGGTFRAPSDRAPVVLYCDSNILFAQRNRDSGHGDAAVLTEGEVTRIAERERAIYDDAFGITTLSDQAARSFVSDFGLSEDKVHSIHGGPNFEDPGPRGSDADRTGPPTVLFVGRQFERKGGDLLLKAFAKVRDAVPDAELIIIGPDRLEGAGEGVRHLGFLMKDRPDEAAQLLEAYRSADVFCLPTRFEAFGIVYLEAMFHELPCVGPDAWAVPEMIVDGETGYLVTPEDPDAYAERLIELLCDRDRAARMGAVGRERATSYFTWSATAQRMISVLEGAVASR